MAMGTPAVAGPSSGHGCPARLGVASTQDWRVRGLSCTAARRIVADVKAIRHSVTRYARTRHCGAQYCIAVRGFRCRPNRQAVSRERCSRGQQFVSWSWTRPKPPKRH